MRAQLWNGPLDGEEPEVQWIEWPDGRVGPPEKLYYTMRQWMDGDLFATFFPEKFKTPVATYRLEQRTPADGIAHYVFVSIG